MFHHGRVSFSPCKLTTQTTSVIVSADSRQDEIDRERRNGWIVVGTDWLKDGSVRLTFARVQIGFLKITPGA